MGKSVLVVMTAFVLACLAAPPEPCYAQEAASMLPASSPDVSSKRTSDEPPVTVPITQSLNAPPLPPIEPAYRQYPRIGAGLNVSPLGIGIEVARPLSANTNLRAGYNTFHYSDGFQINGINYSAALTLRSVDGLYEWYFHHSFHLSPGLLFYNGNHLNANGNVPGGQTFSLSDVSYVSDPSDPLTGTGKLDFFKLSPMILAGWGNLAPRNGKRVSFRFEFGGVYHGTPHVALNVAGSVCNTAFTDCYNVATNPTIQNDVLTQQQTILHDTAHYGLFPLFSIGMGFVL